MIYIGVDPGKSGAIAEIWEPPAHVRAVRASKFADKTPADMCSLFSNLSGGGVFALIEKVHAMPGQGVTSMFSFGYSAGMLEAFLVAAGIPYEFVRPQEWQKEFGLIFRGKNLTATEKKNRHKAAAQQLFPDMTITHANADALLIAEYCRRTRTAG